MFTPRRHAPIVELLHAITRDPEPGTLPRRVIGQVRPTQFQVPDQVLQRLKVLHLVRPLTQQRDRLGDSTTPQRPQDGRLDLLTVLTPTARTAQVLVAPLE